MTGSIFQLKDEHEIGPFDRRENVQGMRRPHSGRLPFFGFWFLEREQKSSSRSRAVEMWESRVFCEISKGRWKEWETRLWFSTLSTGPAFPRPSVSGTSAMTASGIAAATCSW